jgi:lipopolysaccharide export system permease protein
MTLSLYIARRFAASFGMVFGVFFCILFLVDMVDQVRAFAAADIGLARIAELALMNVPASLYRILPLIMILATVALFLGLARSSELVITRAAGRSGLVTLIAPLVTALGIGGFAVAVLNPVVAATTKRYESAAAAYKLGDASVLSVSREGLWLRQGGDAGQTVIRAARSNLDGTTLSDVTFLTFAPETGPVSRIEAATAELMDGSWSLTDAKEWRFGDGANAEQSARSYNTLSLASDLTAARIRDSFGDPSIIPVWELPAFIASLERAGFSARRHQIWFQTEIALPLLLAAMVLVGAGFTMRPQRSGGTGLMVLLALVFGFAIFFLRNFAQVLGENGQIPVLMAAWTPPVAAILLSLGLLLHVEEG